MLILGHLGLVNRISQLRTREVGRVLGARPLLSLAAFLSLLFAHHCFSPDCVSLNIGCQGDADLHDEDGGERIPRPLTRV